jgi:hypothetical protein
MRPGKSLTWQVRVVGLLVAICAPLVAGCGSEEDKRPATWSYIYPAIIEPSCATASCHSDFTRRAGVNFGFEYEAWFQLVCRHFVAPMAPQNSEVLYLMTATGARRMPPDFPLPNADIAKISQWIMAGAANDIDMVTTCPPL